MTQTLQNLSAEEAATRLNSNARTVRWWCANGYFPGAIRVYPGWSIPVAEVDAFKKPKPRKEKI